MKRRIIALILVMGLLAGMGVDGKKALAADSTPAGQTKEIAKIEVVDTEIELPYKSTFTKENVVIKVTYEDGTDFICKNSCRCKWILWKRIRSPACGSAAW